AREKYADAFVKRGTLTIVREGKALKYKKNYKKPVEVQKDDVIRSGRRSYVKLKTVERTTIFMGSNAVFQVRPWKQKKEQGFLRMLFGKAKFKTAKLKSKRRKFSLKTAMAVIGVKGTGWKQSTASSGATDTDVSEGVVQVTPFKGPPINLGAGQRSLTISQNEVSNPIETGKESSSPADEDKDPEDLDAPSPTSKQSTEIDGENKYVETGNVDQSKLDESKKESVDIDETLEDVRDKSLKDGASGELNDDKKEIDKELIPARSNFDSKKIADDAGQQNLDQTGSIDAKFEK
ncbi:MAG: hypothetical protein GY786_01355, partial [Proteobacteria bacterium]|nr:hypothetical protein [Pseudomonadota bacterium]